jgi:hypothetical protein
VEFRLTYEGPLYAASNSGPRRPRHKHEIRRVFHKQLRTFWGGHPFLKNAIVVDPVLGPVVNYYKGARNTSPSFRDSQ